MIHIFRAYTAYRVETDDTLAEFLVLVENNDVLLIFVQRVNCAVEKRRESDMFGLFLFVLMLTVKQ